MSSRAVAFVPELARPGRGVLLARRRRCWLVVSEGVSDDVAMPARVGDGDVLAFRCSRVRGAEGDVRRAGSHLPVVRRSGELGDDGGRVGAL